MKIIGKRKFSLSKVSLILIFILPIYACNDKDNVQEVSEVSNEELRTNFKTPPENAKPWTYWYWINNHISKEGITKDLESMADIGIGAALIGNIYLDDIPAEEGEVPMLSEEWKELTLHAIREGGRLGVDIGLFNSPGWSQSGGPWNDESNSMRYLNSTEFQVTGGRKISMQLTKPTEDFQDVSLLAFPSVKEEEYNNKFRISADKQVSDIENIIDSDTMTSMDLTGLKELTLSFEAQTSEILRTLKIYPSKSTFTMDVKVQAELNGKWEDIRSFHFDRRSAMDQLGFDDYPPVVISFPEVNAQKYRLELTNISPTLNSQEIGLTEVSFSPQPYLEYYFEKQLAKMHQTPLPLDDAYKWPDQPEPKNGDFVLSNENIINISDKLSEDGTLNWNAPGGDWTILRMGMSTTGVTNGPAAPNATGLEVDKINKDALEQHFEGFIGDILSSMPAEDRKAFKYVVADSYETGSQNWTDDFAKSFQETYSYNPVPFLPVLTGRIVNSVDESNRFLWDLRRLVADKVAYEYVGGLRELCEENDLQLWLENYGHWGFPSEFLKYGGQSHLIGGEFWAEGDLGSIECRAASSAAHIYGKNQVSAESYTAAGDPYLRHPGMLKKRGDWSFTEGINHAVFHVYIQQPYDSIPGVNAWFGTEFNRNNTWFNEAKPWVNYQRRSQFMLQQGRYVADVAYFIGEDAPKMTGVTNPELPKGYSFDYINAEVLKERISVKDGRITLPDGLSYRILVLPDVETMRPELLEKIKDFVEQGAVIMGNPPKRSPSLQNFTEADRRVQELVKELWGENYSGNKRIIDYGEGKVFPPMDLALALEQLGSMPDFKIVTEEPVLWIHRKMADKDIYFITNQSDERISFEASFRLTGMQPEFWDATTGSTRKLPEFTEAENYTNVPLELEPAESGFIVFTKDEIIENEQQKHQNFGRVNSLKTLENPWSVHFKNSTIDIEKTITMDQLKDWIQLEDSDLKYYSGTAIYQNTFDLNKIPLAKRVFLDIGKADVIVNIEINGTEVGGLWTAPWRIDVTDYLKEGENNLELAVTNLWVNQLVGDSDRNKEGKKTWTLLNTDYSENPLQPSGLVGPVRLVSIDEVYGTLTDEQVKL